MLQIYNTMTASKESFEQKGDAVRIYVCGVTVYDFCHIGHARSAVAFDTVRRAMKWLGMNVIFAKNFTDIDDKIIRKANETGIFWKEITRTYIEAHNEDMDAIGILRPDETPRATDYIAEMISYCERLIASGHAYESGGDIYYRVNNFQEYGKLSHRNLEELQAGARVEVNDLKENPLDFALWKSAKPGEPSWTSPWGEGRPGWHIECSVMSEKLLGMPLDIHGGGQDLIFPHHENEIAQSEACSCQMARLWMHNGFVNINKEKMSKSLGNFFTIRDILRIVDGEVLRFFLLTTHYRQPLEYADTKMFEAETALSRIYTFKDELQYALPSKSAPSAAEAIENMKNTFDQAFKQAIEDDFNTPQALAALFEMVRAANTLLMNKLNKDELPMLRETCEAIFKDVSDVMGICGRSAQEWFAANLTLTTDEVQAAIDERKAARAEKDFAKADAIRQGLAEKGVELFDTQEGTRYRTRRIR
jgi:cysteinyl-tRNA synthetase